MPQVLSAVMNVPVIIQRLVCVSSTAWCLRFSSPPESWISCCATETGTRRYGGGDGAFDAFCVIFRAPPAMPELSASFSSFRALTAVSARGLQLGCQLELWCCGHTHTHKVVINNNNNNNNTIWGGSVLTGEEPPPHSGELKHALPQTGGPTQSQLSRPRSSGHHISMEHRLRRKQLNSDTNASNKTYLKEIQEKRKEEIFSSEKMKKENEKH